MKNYELTTLRVKSLLFSYIGRAEISKYNRRNSFGQRVPNIMVLNGKMQKYYQFVYIDKIFVVFGQTSIFLHSTSVGPILLYEVNVPLLHTSHRLLSFFSSLEIYNTTHIPAFPDQLI